MKKCIKCGVEKEFTEFDKRKSGSNDGYRNDCKECKSDYNKEYSKLNKDKVLKKKSEYYDSNKDKIIEHRKKYYETNKQSILEKTKENYLIKKDSIIEYQKGYRKNNKEKISENKREYNKNNAEQIKLYKQNNRDMINKTFNERYHNDGHFKSRIKIKNLISNSIRKGNFTKKSKTFEILGCSHMEFIMYIESQFEEWMNWNNHGDYTGSYNETWQYDHIYPISLGLSEEETIKLNHYTNFRPLCSRKNLEKSNKIQEIKNQ